VSKTVLVHVLGTPQSNAAEEDTPNKTVNDSGVTIFMAASSSALSVAGNLAVVSQIMSRGKLVRVELLCFWTFV
jgi:hypothetical protein